MSAQRPGSKLPKSAKEVIAEAKAFWDALPPSVRNELDRMKDPRKPRRQLRAEAEFTGDDARVAGMRAEDTAARRGRARTRRMPRGGEQLPDGEVIRGRAEALDPLPPRALEDLRAVVDELDRTGGYAPAGVAEAISQVYASMFGARRLDVWARELATAIVFAREQRRRCMTASAVIDAARSAVEDTPGADFPEVDVEEIEKLLRPRGRPLSDQQLQERLRRLFRP